MVDRRAPAQGSAAIPVDETWLTSRTEAAIDPDLPIVDAHIHLVDTHYARYLLDELLADAAAGHNIVGSVFVESGAMHRPFGDPLYRPVGETEFANGVAAMSASGRYGPARHCAAIVARADLTAGDQLPAILDQHRARAGDRLRGIRHTVAWDSSADVRNPTIQNRPGIWAEPAFRAGLARLARADLPYEAWGYHPQLGDLANLAAQVPDARIMMDHVGGPIGIGPYAADPAATFRQWRDNLALLARQPNVWIKLSGLGMRLSGLAFHMADLPPTSAEVATRLKPFLMTALDLFGPARCLFASNFPPDRGSYSYAVIWNAFKLLTAELSADECAALFGGNAIHFYRLDQLAGWTP